MVAVIQIGLNNNEDIQQKHHLCHNIHRALRSFDRKPGCKLILKSKLVVSPYNSFALAQAGEDTFLAFQALQPLT